MTVLVTGATGFVGRRVVEELSSRNISTKVLLRSRAGAAALEGLDVKESYGDVTNPESLHYAMQDVESVVHLAAVIREKGDATFQYVNYVGTSNVVEAAKTVGVKRFVHASTIGAVSDEKYAYMRSRWRAEEAVKQSGIPYTILRFSVGFGEGDEFFNVLAAQMKLMPIIPVAGSGKATFQPIAVADSARCLVEALNKPEMLGKTIELGGPERLTYDKMLDEVGKALGRRPIKIHLPLAMVRPAVWMMERTLPRPPVTSEQLKMLDHDSVAGLDGVQKHFGFEPKSVRNNLDYVKRIGFGDALKINLGRMPNTIRDH
ncbi:MAG: complex I NDUFA9 subunit family protein [Chloroflexi bacterium]|nr:complex I NDUFA9 subunit family protein [Chloroflexota bacterium]